MSFKLAAPQGVAIPRVVERDIASGYAEEEGALLVITAGKYVACAADPATVQGIALGPGGADTTGFNKTARKEFPSLRLGAFAPLPTTLFRARYVGTLPANDGAQYGVVRDTDGFWKVDFAEVTTKVVNLVGRLTASPESIPEVLVTFIPSVIGQN